MSEAKRLRRLRMELIDRHPFWGHLLLQLRLREAPDLPTLAATDCATTIWINPTLTQHLTEPELGFVLLHELGHVVLRSADRRKGRQLHRWNVATDYAINRMVADIRRHPDGPPLYSPPTGPLPGLGSISVLLDPRFDGRIAEAIYEELDDDELPACQRVSATLPGGGLPVDLHGGFDAHLSAGDVLRAGEHVDAALAAWEAQPRGEVPGLAQRRLRPTRAEVPWDRVLAELLERTAGDDEASRRPHRRWLARGLIAPSTQADRVGEVVVALDTSASMSRDVLGRVAAELRPLRERARSLTLLTADAQVHQVVPGDRLDEFFEAGRAVGGGGTDHRPVFDWLRTHAPAARLFVGLTDLFSCFPDSPPPCPVIWVVPPLHGAAPWGRVVVANTETRTP